MSPPSEWRQVGLLVGLRWRLLVNSCLRSPLRLLALAGVGVWMLSFSIRLAALVHGWQRDLPKDLDAELLFVLLSAGYFLFILAPVYGAGMSEGLETARARHFPLRSRTLFAGSIGSLMLDLPGIVALPVVVVLLVDYGQGPASAVWTAVTLLILGLNLACGSLALSGFVRGLFQSRQRLASIILSLLLAAVVGAALLTYHFLLAHERALTDFTGQMLLANYPSRWLIWLPPGLAARSVVAGGQGEWGIAAAFALALVAWTVPLAWAGSRLLEAGDRAAFSGEGGSAKAGLAQQPGAVPSTAVGLIRKRLSPALVAVVLKEAKCLWREPQIRASLALLPVAVIPLFLMIKLYGLSHRVIATMWSMAIAGSALAHLAFNVFGMDREGLNSLFQFPVDRRWLLAGKNVAVGATGIVMCLLTSAPVGILWHDWRLVGLTLLAFTAALPVFLGVGNLASIWFPYRVPRRGENPFNTGLVRVMITGTMHILFIGGAGIVAVPALVTIILPWAAKMPALLLAAAPLAFAYSLGIYSLALPHAARLLQTRETRILESCQNTDSLFA